MSDIINQTEFTEKSHPIVETPAPTPVVSVEPKKSKLPLIVAIISVVVIVVGSISFVTYSTKKVTPVVITPMPSASEAPIETKAIRTEIAPYLKVIEDSNPEADEHPFPPVHFEIRIKDPAVR